MVQSCRATCRHGEFRGNCTCRSEGEEVQVTVLVIVKSFVRAWCDCWGQRFHLFVSSYLVSEVSVRRTAAAVFRKCTAEYKRAQKQRHCVFKEYPINQKLRLMRMRNHSIGKCMCELASVNTCWGLYIHCSTSACRDCCQHQQSVNCFTAW